MQLIPVLTTMLKFSPEEKQRLFLIASGKLQSYIMLPNLTYILISALCSLCCVVNNVMYLNTELYEQ